MKTVIYGLFCPLEGAVRYIGKSSEVEKRFKAHLYAANSAGRTHKQRWIAKVLAAGLQPSLVILEQVSGEPWQDCERRWIAKALADGWPLTNVAKGGEGSSPLTEAERAKKIQRLRDPETRRRMSESAKARWADPDKRAKAEAALKSDERRRIGRDRAIARATPEYREMMAAKSRAAWADPSKRERIVSGITDQTREAVSAAAKRMWAESGREKSSRMLANLRSRQ